MEVKLCVNLLVKHEIKAIVVVATAVLRRMKLGDGGVVRILYMSYPEV